MYCSNRVRDQDAAVIVYLISEDMTKRDSIPLVLAAGQNEDSLHQRLCHGAHKSVEANETGRLIIATRCHAQLSGTSD